MKTRRPSERQDTWVCALFGHSVAGDLEQLLVSECHCPFEITIHSPPSLPRSPVEAREDRCILVTGRQATRQGPRSALTRVLWPGTRMSTQLGTCAKDHTRVHTCTHQSYM